jgi:hypothetical protein
MKKNVLGAAIMVVLGAAGAYVYLLTTRSGGGSPGGAGTAMCTRHAIAEKDCPWCDPSLIEKLGQCPGHGVPEAFCSRCNPALIPGFEAENDWCAGHGVPESQCEPCKAGHLPPGEKPKEQSRLEKEG